MSLTEFKNSLLAMAIGHKKMRFLQVYHCEMLCCLPGNAEWLGLKWSSEQVESTKSCLGDMTTWMAERIL